MNWLTRIWVFKLPFELSTLVQILHCRPSINPWPRWVWEDWGEKAQEPPSECQLKPCVSGSSCHSSAKIKETNVALLTTATYLHIWEGKLHESAYLLLICMSNHKHVMLNCPGPWLQNIKNTLTCYELLINEFLNDLFFLISYHILDKWIWGLGALSCEFSSCFLSLRFYDKFCTEGCQTFLGAC